MRSTCVLLSCVVGFVCCITALSQAQQGRRMSRAEIAERVRQFDVNHDGMVTREEFKGPENIFRFIDKNGDGVITAAELDAFVKAGDQPAPAGAPVGSIAPDVKPLSEMSAADRYKGQDGGLYGNGQNTPPPAHREAALREAAKVQPLDADGNPSPAGKIGFISVGMSNATMEFTTFLQQIRSLKLNPRLIVVDGAQGGKTASVWAQEPKNPRTNRTPWEELAERLKANALSPLQVQVAWMKMANARPAGDGEFPAHIDKFHAAMVTTLQKLKARYPNLRIVYLSNRIFAGYATSPLNPEPYAYEYAYGVRGLILDQIAGKPELNCDADKGEVKAPLLLWGPDLWANGTRPRQDGLAWEKTDVGADGTHPSMSGREKVAKLLLNFLQTDPTAKTWFLATPAEAG